MRLRSRANADKVVGATPGELMRGVKAVLADDGDVRQRFLVMVHPGTSGRTEVFR
ncbi:hypothetical protein [Nonomuraea roseoviolacea]|uniref:Uncharacterized protein n=1 Tax=Nonomuraea roseoviolacea subsp. carminata TaxID=160689 RepID=A0ABT1K6E5_9ACTN|nr:hypothetical protein [Nonomuraea roseoviolacea]MCP2349575.1 hypothetical protein [Nonomuraea roseoviolacea subsp. carminata]